MKIPASLRVLLSMHYSNIVLLLGSMAAAALHTGIRDALGYFHYVLLFFALLFICLEINVVVLHSELTAFGI